MILIFNVRNVVILLLFFCAKIFQSAAFGQTVSIAQYFKPLGDNILMNGDSNGEFNDLLLKASGSKIISVGEVTHGSQEVLKFQILLAKSLIEKHDVRTIILAETHLLRTYKIYDFLINERLTLEENVSEEFPMLEEFLQWVQDFNRKNKGKVTVIGSDVDEPKEVLGFINEHFSYYTRPDLREDLKGILHVMNKKGNLHLKEAGSIKSKINGITHVLNSQKGVSDSLDFKIDVMLISLERFVADLKTINDKEKTYLNRDLHIFEFVNWLNSTSEESKTLIISAHNYHINKKPLLPQLFRATHTLGELLQKQYGADYYTIATELNTGTFSYNPGNIMNVKEDKSKLGSTISENFPDVKYGYIISEGDTKQVLNNPQLSLTFGAGLSTLLNGNGMIGDAFNAILYIAHSTPYKYFKSSPSFHVLCQIDRKLLKEITKEKKFYWSIDFETDTLTLKSSTVFYNDFDFPVLSRREKDVKTQKQYNYTLPENYSKAVLWLTVSNGKSFTINHLKINNKNITPKDFVLLDYDKQGYSIKNEEEGRVSFSMKE